MPVAALLRGLHIAALLLGAYALASQPACAQSADVAGVYALKGVREVAAQLHLKRDGRFEFGMAYGAVDQQAQGRWTARDSVVSLTADAPSEPGFVLGELKPELLDAYGTEPGNPTLLAVRVSSPKLGMVWSNMRLTAQFSNGKERTGTTGRSGMMGFLELEAPEWKGATVRRVGVSYPPGNVGPVWFDIDNARTKGVEIHFEPGWLTASAFRSATLRIDQRDGAKDLVLISGEFGQPGWRFVGR